MTWGQATKAWPGGQLNERPISRILDEAENGRPTADYKHAKGARSRQDPAEQIRKLCVTGSSSAFPPKTPISAAMRASVHAESPIERRGGCRLLDQLRLGLAGRGRVIEDGAAVR